VSSQAKYRIPTLDGWRAVAILAVLVAHSAWLFAPGCFFESARVRHVARFGGQGVDLFFAISGFLITSLLLAEMEKTGAASLRGFYTRRVFRILPPLIAYLLVLAGLAVWWRELVAPWEFAASLLFFRNYTMQVAGGRATNHFWTLSVEEHFYLFWPALLVFAGRRRALKIAIGIALCVAVWRGLDGRMHLFATLFGTDPGRFLRTDTRIDGILWG
jgi:peptidoglycan/LPS O-acetylase OafA/YrhL